MRGDRTCLSVEMLVEEHLVALYRLAYRLTGSSSDAQDLVQDTFLVAVERLGQLRDPQSALAWLMKIMRRAWSRQRRARPAIEPVAVEEIAEEPRAASVLDEVDPVRLTEVLDSLPDEYREPLLLFYFGELRYREIADVLDCPLGTVMSRIARAKAFLRARLSPERALRSAD